MIDEPIDSGRDDHSAAPSRDRAINAGQWYVGSQVVQGLLQFGFGIVLARLLPPADFGIAALALVVIGLATIVSDLGLGPAIVQQEKLTSRHLRVAFTASLVFGVVIALALVLMAPAIGAFTRSAAVTPVMRVQSLLFLSAGAGIVARALLQRALAFRRLFIIDVISYLFGYALVASIGAMYGLGVWSLVLGSLAQALIASGLSIVMTRAPIRPLFAMAELRELLGFGMGVSISGIAAYCGRTGDNFMVGRLLGPAALGFYARAFNLMMLPLNYVCSALPNVLIPIFARLQHDRARVGRGFLLSVQATGLVIAPVMAGLAVAAPHMIIGLYGERWSPVVVPLQILCSVGLPRAVVSLAGAVNRTCGGVYAELRLQVLFAAAVLASASIGSERGVAGVALLVSASILCMYAATTRIALRATSQAWRAFGAAHLPGIFLGLFTAGLTCGLRLVLERTDLSHLSIFLLLALAAGLSVPVGIYLLPSFLRPTELLLAVRQAGARLPGSLRGGLMFLLRLPV